jgi:hypothetical protein
VIFERASTARAGQPELSGLHTERDRDRFVVGQHERRCGRSIR